MVLRFFISVLVWLQRENTPKTAKNHATNRRVARHVGHQNCAARTLGHPRVLRPEPGVPTWLAEHAPLWISFFHLLFLSAGRSCHEEPVDAGVALPRAPSAQTHDRLCREGPWRSPGGPLAVPNAQFATLHIHVTARPER